VPVFFRLVTTLLLFGALLLPVCFSLRLYAQEKPKTAETNAEKSPQLPAQIELLETRARFESDGDSRKEVHARVHINDELGVRQFARLNFDYNRSFQRVEIPLVRITHTSGGTADILPSAVSDQPHPAVVNFPAYQDVRVKSVRILGLEPGDNLEYRVITTTMHHPLEPDFWLDHTFDRSGVVTQENFALDIPAALAIKPKINPETPLTSSSSEGQGIDARTIYHWSQKNSTLASSSEKSDTRRADISISTFRSWDQLAEKLAAVLVPSQGEIPAALEKQSTFYHGAVDGKVRETYDFVSKKIRTVYLPLGATGYRRRKPTEILNSGYGTPEDKFVLFAAVLGIADAGFLSEPSPQIDRDSPSPTRFSHLLTSAGDAIMSSWADLSLEVAPLWMIPPQFQNKPVFVVGRDVETHWQIVNEPIYSSSQRVKVAASLGADGKLTAKVHYLMRGENELLLRVAFHQSPQEKWNEVAQLLALSDGFRGKVVNARASDPYATEEPFTVEYEITQPKFVDWSKKPVRIPALLPLLGLPDAPAKPAPGSASSTIELGTPLDVHAEVTLYLPPGTTARTPTGSSVDRDYATFRSHYAAQNQTVTASRHVHFLLRQIPAARAADYKAFVRAVQTDEAQDLTLERTEVASEKGSPSPASSSASVPKP
jgi:hypothetical protein